MTKLLARFCLSILLILGPTVAHGQPSVVGTWDPPVDIQVEGVHADILPNGKVLYLPYRENPDGTTPSVVFDPDDPGSANYVTTPQNYFCGGHTMLADGKVLYNGGETLSPNPFRATAYFDFLTETWIEVGFMNRPRWYPSTIQLGDGVAWTFGGQNEPADADTNDPTIEFYSEKTGQWTMAGGQGIPGQYVEAYNRLHLLPDGRIFQTGHLPDTYVYDPVARTWTFVGDTNLNRARGNGASVQLQDGRFMIIGGEDKINYFSSCEVIDMSLPNPQWQNVASMSTPRAFINAIVLPDANVLVLGGDEGVAPNQLIPELYNPSTNTWSNMAPFTLHRGYHSTMMLLPDARVIIGGGEGHDGPGVFGETSFYEIYNPYYLFGSARPTIQSLAQQATYGSQLTMQYSSAVAASHVVIYRPGSQTHSFSYNHFNRRIDFDSDNGSTATFTLPTNPNLLPPSFYMVFLMTTDGVPSVARWLQIGGSVNSLIFGDGFETGNTSGWTTAVP